MCVILIVTIGAQAHDGKGGFKSCLVQQDTYFLVCQRYIELNPDKAGMVEEPAEIEMRYERRVTSAIMGRVNSFINR